MSKAMKVKLIASIIVLVSCVAIIATSTWAWYMLSSNEDVEMELHADGMVVLAFETTITVTPEDGVMKPAVETTDAIANNATYPDVLTVGGGIAEAAQAVTFVPVLNVYLDKVYDDGTPVPQVLNFGVSAIIETKGEGNAAGERYEIPEERIPDVFGLEWTMQIEDMFPTEPVAGELPVIDVLAHGAGTEAERNKIIHFVVKVWLKAPEGLMPPEFIGAKVTIRLAISADDRD